MTDNDYQELRQLLDDYLRMYASRDDQLTKYFSDDFSGFTGGGDRLVKDREEWVAITRQDFAQVKDPINIELKDVAIQSLSNTVAVATSFFIIHLPIKDHILSKETARLVLIFNKEENGWKISHSSISIPYHLVQDGEIYPLKELVERNRFLEEQVNERTAQLTESNDKLQSINNDLLAEIEFRKLIEAKLIEREYFFAETQRAALVGSYKYDFISCQWESSEVLDHIFGIDKNFERTIESWLDIVHPDDRKMMVDYLTLEVITKGMSFSKTYRIVRRNDKEIKWVYGKGEIKRNSSGDPVALYGTISDITDRMKNEQELEKKNTEIEQFIYTVSHDLRSPLVTIKTFMGYLEEDLAKENAEHLQKDIHFINSAADKMKILLDELMEFSRIGRTDQPGITVQLQVVLTDALDALAGTISERNVEVKLLNTDILIHGDRQRLCEIWQNLIENAIKYCPATTQPLITLGILQEVSETVFFVKDNGIGINPDYHEKIFGIFDKLDQKSPGAGLGLSMVKRIVEKYDGRIWVESEGDGKGSTFYFTLPTATFQAKLNA